MSREKTTGVVMLCGPRTPDGFPETVRIMHAVKLALSERTTLYIVGDAHNGEDVARYASMAREHAKHESTKADGAVIGHMQTIKRIVPVLNLAKEADTWTNAQAIAKEMVGVTRRFELFLVTEVYHMPRAKLLLERALREVCGDNAPKVTEAPVTSAVPTDRMILINENFLRAKLGIHVMLEIPKEARAAA